MQSSNSIASKIQEFKVFVAIRKKSIAKSKFARRMANREPLFQRGTITIGEDGFPHPDGSILLDMDETETGEPVVFLTLRGIRRFVFHLTPGSSFFTRSNLQQVIFRIEQETYVFQGPQYQVVANWLTSAEIPEISPDDGIGSGESSPGLPTPPKASPPPRPIQSPPPSPLRSPPPSPLQSPPPPPPSSPQSS